MGRKGVGGRGKEGGRVVRDGEERKREGRTGVFKNSLL